MLAIVVQEGHNFRNGKLTRITDNNLLDSTNVSRLFFKTASCRDSSDFCCEGFGGVA